LRKRAAFDRLQFTITYSKTKLVQGQILRMVLQVTDSMTGALIRKIPCDEVAEAFLEIDEGKGGVGVKASERDFF
tara:strand:- start:769 stop:993 length:225 start_codon:yes stop_codon:yes gene_type:complete